MAQPLPHEAYVYAPLPTPTHLRRCIIHPAAAFDDPLIISIDVVDFDDLHGGPNPPPHYEALSYVWGSEENPLPISVDCPEDGTQRSLFVTRNLECALRNMRILSSGGNSTADGDAAPTHRIMWTDAICINQKDNVEKGPQVAMMGRIYKLASRVIIWLGPAADNSDAALRFMDGVASSVKNLGSISQTLEIDTDVIMRAFEHLIYQDEEGVSRVDTRAPAALLDRPWFSRVWVRQEAFLANEESLVVCGGTVIRWVAFKDSLDGTFGAVQRQPPEEYADRLDELSDRVSAFIHHKDDSLTSLLVLRTFFRFLKCKDPRDYVYGALGMMPPWGKRRVPIVPDYTKPYQDVYRHAVVLFAEGTGFLGFLGQCDLDPKPYKKMKKEKTNDQDTAEMPPIMPSWVPDWSREPKMRIPGPIPIASAQIMSQYRFIGDQDDDQRVLRVAGVLAAKITSLGPKVEQTSEYYDQTDMLRHCMSEVDWSSLLDDKTNNLLKLYSRTLRGGIFSDRYHPPAANMPRLDTDVETLRQVLLDEDYEPPDARVEENGDNATRSLDVMCAHVNGRRLGRDANGTPVLCPWQTKRGDFVAIVLGCPDTLVLRETDDGGFLVVGQCYSVNACDGTPLLGPLPGNTRATYTTEGDMVMAFVDDDTGQVSYLDPRLKHVQGLQFEHNTGENTPGAIVSLEFEQLRDLVHRRTGGELRWLDLV